MLCCACCRDVACHVSFSCCVSADSFLLPATYQLSTDSYCKDTKLKTESQVFWDFFSKKIQSRSRFCKTYRRLKEIVKLKRILHGKRKAITVAGCGLRVAGCVFGLWFMKSDVGTRRAALIDLWIMIYELFCRDVACHVSFLWMYFIFKRRDAKTRSFYT